MLFAIFCTDKEDYLDVRLDNRPAHVEHLRGIGEQLIFAGPTADRLGVQTWFIAGGVVTALLGVVAFFIPAVVNIEDGNNTDGQVADGSLDDSAALTAVSPLEISGD